MNAQHSALSTRHSGSCPTNCGRSVQAGNLMCRPSCSAAGAGAVSGDEVTVHILYQGISMCPLKLSATRMPEGHRGAPMTEHYKTNCNECFNEWARFYDD